jgi:hypothetical protein
MLSPASHLITPPLAAGSAAATPEGVEGLLPAARLFGHECGWPAGMSCLRLRGPRGIFVEDCLAARSVAGWEANIDFFHLRGRCNISPISFPHSLTLSFACSRKCHNPSIWTRGGHPILANTQPRLPEETTWFR